jgi:hypothetical protein
MRHRFAASLALSLLSCGASAATSEPTYHVECSSPSGVTRPSAGVLGCDGDLRLFDGRWDAAAGTGLTISATGTLSLDNLSLSASYIVLSGRDFALGNDVTIRATESIRIGDGTGSLAIAPGPTLSVAGPAGDVVYRGAEALQAFNAGGSIGVPGSVIVISPVPEPTTIALWLSGLALLASRWRRRLPFQTRACQHAVT